MRPNHLWIQSLTFFCESLLFIQWINWIWIELKVMRCGQRKNPTFHWFVAVVSISRKYYRTYNSRTTRVGISIGREEQLSFRTRTAAEQKANDAQFSFVIPHYSIHGGGMAAINCCCHLHAIHNPREGESLRRVLPKICPRWWDKK